MKNKKIIIGLALLVALAIIIFYFNNNSVNAEGKYDEFAKCLTENNAVMYGTDWCGYCKKQKELFGKSFNEVDFVNCDYDKENCIKQGVQGYPTWKINNQNYPGVQPLEKLSELTGCEL